MSPENRADVAARDEQARVQKNKLRAVETLERALWRWRSERKIDGADASLLEALAACHGVIEEHA